jgi:hypothetical protein
VRSALIVLTAAAALAALGAGSVASGAPAACKPGVTRVNGLSARVFCGPAKATVHYGSKVFTYRQGECEKTSQYVAVNVGTVILGQTSKPKPNYFGLLIGKSPAGGTKPASHDGTYTGGVLALDYGGKGYLVRGDTLTVTLKGGRSRGTLTGASLFDHPPVKVTGSFSC